MTQVCNCHRKKKAIFARTNTEFVKKHVLLPIFLLLILTNSVNCQVKSIFDEVEQNSPQEGKVQIIQEGNIKEIVEKHQWNRSKKRGIEGYRIRIYSNSGPEAKNEFEVAKARFINLNFDVRTYEEFDYPFYKIYVGDFRTRSEAMYLLKKIEYQFPGAFIVQKQINYPNL